MLAFDLVGWGTLALAVGTLAVVLATLKVATGTQKIASTAESDLEHTRTLVKASQEQVAASLAQVKASQEQVAAGLAQAKAIEAQVTASQAQAGAATEALALSVRPLIVPATGLEGDTIPAQRVFESAGLSVTLRPPPDVATWVVAPFGNINVHWVILRVRNIGNGPALFDRNDPAALFLRTHTGTDIYGRVDSLVIAPQDFAYLAFADPKEPSDAASLSWVLHYSNTNPDYPGNSMTVVVGYADVGRERWTTTRIKIRPRGQGGLEPAGVEFDLPGPSPASAGS
jgi:hypothetical protein